ncbi:MAG: CDP-alcohol phosphatidyltransferase family protein [Deltaproteobacteria bacterium]|nr:CDP-alcohol phosphatidyltransferase family protein [Deltaproteobacteria bacterium]
MAREHRTLTDWVKLRTGFIVGPLASLLSRTGIHPNLLSIAGALLALFAGIAVAADHLVAGAWLFLVSGPFDALDGAVARTSGRVSPFGAFLDSCLDRYSEAALLCGLLYWSVVRSCHGLVLLCFVTMFGSLMVSYTRARAEGLGMACKTGWFTRMERFVVITIMLFTRQFLAGLVVLALMTNMTACQRMVHVYKMSRQG